jgi:hypothetical protein
MIAALIISLVLGVLLLAVVSGGANTAKSKAKPTGKPSVKLNPKTVQSRWSVIQSLMTQGGNGLRQAVMEADKLLDYVLQGKGYHGNTMGERMRSANREFSRRNDVWAAHKLRNALAHEVGFDLVPSQVKQAISAFERAIKDLDGGL